MDTDQPHIPAMSLHLSRTLDEIGLNSLTVKRRRKAYLVIEQMRTWEERITGVECAVYHFGSQTEGATTLGLDSDIDYLCCYDDFNVIQSLEEWEQDKENLLMLQENIAPGYCRLQCLRPDKLVARDTLPHEDCAYDERGRVILKNTITHDGRDRNGPAMTLSFHGFMDNDLVGALKCNSWPAQAEEFTRRLRRHGWPSEHLLQEAVQHGVFLVGVGHKQSPPEVEPLEWRISASMAERCLMFSLTIVHLKCYVVLKMLVKTFVEPHVRKCISSYHCKTALFHCTENTEAGFWRDDNLIKCVIRCLEMLLTWVTNGFCPHFILHEENLFAGKVTEHNKGALQSILKKLIRRTGQNLLQIHLNDLGQKLQTKINTTPSVMPVLNSWATMVVFGVVEVASHEVLHGCTKDILLEHVSKESLPLIHFVCQTVDTLKNIIKQSVKHEQHAIQLFIKFLSCWLGSLQASIALSENNTIPPNARQLFPNETNNDVSSMLKLASICYCYGNLSEVETMLQSVETHLSRNITMPMCRCNATAHPRLSREFFNALFSLKGMKARAKLFTHCVIFSPQEIQCAPQALRAEFYRSFGDDVQHRDPDEDGWMDLAAVDCLPYLYYLQYLTYRQLGNQGLQSRSLKNLHRCVREDHSFGHHETAWNLLGQCNELDLKPSAAMACYKRSLDIRPRNNAANWHIQNLRNRSTSTCTCCHLL